MRVNLKDWPCQSLTHTHSYVKLWYTLVTLDALDTLNTLDTLDILDMLDYLDTLECGCGLVFRFAGFF